MEDQVGQAHRDLTGILRQVDMISAYVGRSDFSERVGCKIAVRYQLRARPIGAQGAGGRAPCRKCFDSIGGAEGDRTPDLRIANALDGPLRSLPYSDIQQH